MRLIADLHLHSPYSRATSKEISPLSLSLWSALKGINIVGTGDILHPKWLGELKESLVYKDGLFSLEDSLMAQLYPRHGIEEPPLQRFLLTGEISCIYKQEGRVRKVHHLLLFPDFEGVEGLRKRLDPIGNLQSDGRPIVGLDSYTLLSLLLESCPDAVLIPAHVWTPWFSLFGSHSGFDSVEECFRDLSPHIYALETGLSSDPPMNRLVSKLDRYQ
ncbi:MAG: endonuclease Q family protein, partial [Desulfatiglandales bacterium]